MIVESIKKGFELWKKDFVNAALYGTLLAILEFATLIPIVGAFVYAWFYPKVLRNFGKKYQLIEKEADLKPAFLALLVPSLIANLGILVLFGTIIFNLIQGKFAVGNFELMFVKYFIPLLVVLLIVAILSMILLFTVYGNVVGKIEKFEIDIIKSLSLLIISIVIGLIGAIISSIIGFVPKVGGLISFIIGIVIIKPWQALAMLYYAKNS